jgi:four helix bundle protein
MATIKSLEDFKTWQKSRTLNVIIKDLSKSPSFNSDIYLKNQIISASNSIMANLAEGFGRQGNREFIQFLSIAKASATELKSHIYAATDQKLIDEFAGKDIIELIEDIEKKSGKFLQYLIHSDFKGSKFKK